MKLAFQPSASSAHAQQKREALAMMSPVTLEEVEALVAQLPPREQLKLVAQISARLSETVHCGTAPDNAEEERVRQERLRLADQLLAECEGIEDDSQGIDTTELIRRMRDERIAQLCRRDA
jgi:hypothetical protein